MACRVCLERSHADIKRISELVAMGNQIEEISIVCGVPQHELAYHISNCLGQAKETKAEQLEREYTELLQAIEVARDTYLNDPRMPNAQAYTLLLTQLRGLALEVESFENPEKEVEEIATTVLAPLITNIIEVTTSELNRVREEIVQRVGDEHSRSVGNILKELLRRVGSRLSIHQQEALIKLEGKFGVKAKETVRKTRDRFVEPLQ